MIRPTLVLPVLLTVAPFAACAAADETSDEPPSSSGSGAAGTGGQGGAPAGCTSDAQCDDVEPCTTDACTEGECTNTPLSDGSRLPLQTPGDCVVVQCNAGVSQAVDDDADLPDDRNECTADSCARGVPQNTPEPAGAACSRDGGVMCNGDADSPACVECNTPSNCTALPPDNACRTRTCTAGVCGQTFVASGTPIALQSDGDCQVAICDGAGAIAQNVDDADVPEDGNDCTADVCVGGVPSNPAEPIDAPCGSPSSLYCNGAGTCVGCNTAAQCGVALTCQATTCTNGACGVVNLPNGAACDDGIFCNGADGCMFGSCLVHGGDPCAASLGDGDSDCSEACDEASGSCTALEPAGSPCSDGVFCTGTDTCNAGGMCTGSGNPCPGTNVGPACNDSCNEVAGTCTAADLDGTPCAGGVCSGGVCPCPAQLPGFSGAIGPDFSGSCWRQCEGYLDNPGGNDVPSDWGEDCIDPAFNKLRIVCGTSASSYRYIEVNKNVFKDGLLSYPESGLILAAQDQNGIPFAFSNDIYATGNHPHTAESWWAGGQGCNEANTNLTVNNICAWEASNCFGQNIAGPRFLYVYVKE